MLTGPQIHLALNHIPVIASMIGAFLLYWGIFRRDESGRFFGLAILVFSALVSIAVYLSGDPAAHAIRDLPGVIGDNIHDHEEAAEAAFIALLAMGVTALGTLLVQRFVGTPKRVRWVRVGTGLSAVLVLVALILVGWAAHLGGLIRHEELRGPVTPDVSIGEGGNSG